MNKVMFDLSQFTNTEDTSIQGILGPDEFSIFRTLFDKTKDIFELEDREYRLTQIVKFMNYGIGQIKFKTLGCLINSYYQYFGYSKILNDYWLQYFVYQTIMYLLTSETKNKVEGFSESDRIDGIFEVYKDYFHNRYLIPSTNMFVSFLNKVVKKNLELIGVGTPSNDKALLLMLMMIHDRIWIFSKYDVMRAIYYYNFMTKVFGVYDISFNIPYEIIANDLFDNSNPKSKIRLSCGYYLNASIKLLFDGIMCCSNNRQTFGFGSMIYRERYINTLMDNFQILPNGLC